MSVTAQILAKRKRKGEPSGHMLNLFRVRTLATPSTDQIIPLLYWMVPIVVLLVLPGAFASLWGPKFLNPGLVGLLFMTEIIFGSISAALFAGEPFGGREISGILLIASASLLEPVSDLFRARHKAAQSS